MPLRAVIQHLLSLKSYLLLLVAICFSLLVEFGLNQWLPSYYVRQFGLSMTEVGYRYGLAVAIVWNGTPGEPKHQARARDTLTALYEDLELV